MSKSISSKRGVSAHANARCGCVVIVVTASPHVSDCGKHVTVSKRVRVSKPTNERQSKRSNGRAMPGQAA